MSWKEPIILRPVNIMLKTKTVLCAASHQIFQFGEDLSNYIIKTSMSIIIYVNYSISSAQGWGLDVA